MFPSQVSELLAILWFTLAVYARHRRARTLYRTACILGTLAYFGAILAACQGMRYSTHHRIELPPPLPPAQGILIDESVLTHPHTHPTPHAWHSTLTPPKSKPSSQF